MTLEIAMALLVTVANGAFGFVCIFTLAHLHWGHHHD